jgi:NAD(P)-dependent dehydrogenase (short-subunit alcohol dehydrogenase family)
MAPWTTEDIPPLAGRLAVVTGANSGLGFETATALARAGSRVVLACRDQVKGADALDRLLRVVPDGDVEVGELDLADLESVRKFATIFSDTHDRLDILVNNAGVMAIPRRETADGFEMQFGTNHLGHFALTGLLLDRLLAGPGARVVTVSSLVARVGRIRFDDLEGSRHYNAWSAYGQSKLANQLFALELARRATRSGSGLVSVAAHPGYAATNLQSVAPQMTGSGLMERATRLGNILLAQSAAAGALPSLYAATAPEVRGGSFFGPDRLFGSRGHPTSAPFARAARRPDTARRLWAVSEELTGVRFDLLDRDGPDSPES